MMPVSTDECARAILSVTPRIMAVIRTEMRSNRSPDLSVPQFRTLVYLRDHTAASLTEVSDHLTLSLSSTSKLVDGLVKRLLVERRDAAHDRRRMVITLTPSGDVILNQAVQCTLARLSATLESLSVAQRGEIIAAMEQLDRLFNPGEPRLLA